MLNYRIYIITAFLLFSCNQRRREIKLLEYSLSENDSMIIEFNEEQKKVIYYYSNPDPREETKKYLNKVNNSNRAFDSIEKICMNPGSMNCLDLWLFNFNQINSFIYWRDRPYFKERYLDYPGIQKGEIPNEVARNFIVRLHADLLYYLNEGMFICGDGVPVEKAFKINDSTFLAMTFPIEFQPGIVTFNAIMEGQSIDLIDEYHFDEIPQINDQKCLGLFITVPKKNITNYLTFNAVILSKKNDQYRFHPNDSREFYFYIMN